MVLGLMSPALRSILFWHSSMRVSKVISFGSDTLGSPR